MAAPMILSVCRTKTRFAYVVLQHNVTTSMKSATTTTTALSAAFNNLNHHHANFSTETFNSNKSIPKRSSKYIKSIPDKEIRKSVFISQSYDIYTNLALEDWIYRNFDLAHHHILMLWSNNPCVVIGRHQNPFAEANISTLVRDGVQFARRNSGGGTVYHDRGNLNCTFFTPRERYSRNYNLNLITRALYREFNICADISERDDITIFGKKVCICFLFRFKIKSEIDFYDTP